jgi:hypothetical protein
VPDQRSRLLTAYEPKKRLKVADVKANARPNPSVFLASAAAEL